MQRAPRTPTHARDLDNKEIVLVPLANHNKPAKVLREDFEALLSAGYTHNWTFNDAGQGRCYVRVAANDRLGNLAVVARLILDAPKGCVVKYLDRDRLNLRRDNLDLAQGPAKGVTMKYAAA